MLDSEQLDGVLRTHPIAQPGDRILVRDVRKQSFANRLSADVERSLRKYQHRVRFLETCQVQEVRVAAKQEIDVVVPNHRLVCEEESDGAFRHPLTNRLAPFCELRRRHSVGLIDRVIELRERSAREENANEAGEIAHSIITLPPRFDVSVDSRVILWSGCRIGAST